MSSRTWTPPAVASSAATRRFAVWRAVEGQHAVATMALVDSLAEQHALERILDAGKPPVPPDAAHLHYLLFTPFRYAPPPGGSRFRAPTDPGVFYAADAVRTACAELGYWRWRHLTDSPTLAAMPIRPQTVFRVKLAARTVDLRRPPFDADRTEWTDPSDYSACQRFGGIAREAGVEAIRYASVRDPQRGGNCAVLAWSAFAHPAPVEAQTWSLAVTRERVVWQRTDALTPDAHEFVAGAWRAH